MAYSNIVLSQKDSTKVEFSFTSKYDTIKAKVGNVISYQLKVKSPKQENVEEYYASAKLKLSDFSISASDISLTADNKVSVGSEKTLEISFTLKEHRERLLEFTLEAYNKKGEQVEIAGDITSFKLFVEPESELISVDSTGYEFWLFTGTNLDLLDGAKPEELYFKASYLLNMGKDSSKKSNNWLYFTFGKNRYFSDKELFTRVQYTDLVPNSIVVNDTARIASVINGQYNTERQRVTNNVFISGDFFKELSKRGASRLLGGGGLYASLQDIEISYSEPNIIFSDTISRMFPLGEALMFEPIAQGRSIKEFNFNINLSFMHILETEKINIKTSLNTGVSFLNYPFSTTIRRTSIQTEYKVEQRPFALFRMDLVVLKPGVSIGTEAFFRYNEIPLFNFSLTKVFDAKGIKNIFGEVSSISD
jgi:hypothetical protein